MDRAKNTKSKVPCKQAQLLAEILQKITENRLSYHFRLPVDWKSLGLLDYPLLINEPMDLSTVQRKLKAQQYDSSVCFFQDLLLIWRNCRIYNGEGHWLTALALKLEQETNRYLKNYFPNIKLKTKKLNHIRKQMESRAKFEMLKKLQSCIPNQLQNLPTKQCEENQQQIQQEIEDTEVISKKKIQEQHQTIQQRIQKAAQHQNCKEEYEPNAYQMERPDVKQRQDEEINNYQIEKGHSEIDQNTDISQLRRLFLQALETVTEDRVGMLFLLIKRRCPQALTFDGSGDSIINLNKADYQTLYLGMMQILRWNEQS